MVTLGLDIFSLRSQPWTPFEHLDFAARWGVRVVHYSEARFIGGLETEHLKRVRAYAGERGIAIELGMLSICPSSGVFDATQGPAEEQIARMLDAARIVGSPFVRCVVGTLDDRRSPGGIEQRLDDTLRVLKNIRSRVVDAGLRLAIENHAGDLQARELKQLIEAAGPDWVGACVDAGNAVWAIEDPHLTLETLAPYVLTSHTRDSAVWNVPEGAAVAWTRMGDGNVGIEAYIRAFAETCPGRTLSLEIIVLPPRVMAFRDRAFWDAYRHTPAWEFLRFQALADAGHPVAARTTSDPIATEREDVEESLRWTKALLTHITPRAAAE
jgi:sugar phosphate isomerase/epimerase